MSNVAQTRESRPSSKRKPATASQPSRSAVESARSEQKEYGVACLKDARERLLRMIGAFELAIADGWDDDDVAKFREDGAGMACNLDGATHALDAVTDWPVVTPSRTESERDAEADEDEDESSEEVRRYDALTTERIKVTDPRKMTLDGLIAYATGTTEWDLVLALLQEIETRAMTLRSAVSADEATLPDDHLDMELYMLSRKAQAAQELYWRQRARPMPASQRAKAGSTPPASEDLSHAAEE